MKRVKLIDYWTQHFNLSGDQSINGRLHEITTTILKAMKSGQNSCIVLRLFMWKHFVVKHYQHGNKSPLTSPRAIDAMTKTKQKQRYQLTDSFKPLISYLKDQGLQWTLAIKKNENWADFVVYWTPNLEGNHNNLLSEWLTTLVVKSLDDSKIVEWRKICLRAIQAGQRSATLMVLWKNDFKTTGGKLCLVNMWEPSKVYYKNCCLCKRFIVVKEWAKQEGVNIILITQSKEKDWVFLQAEWSVKTKEEEEKGLGEETQNIFDE
jgi:hypothetical protein